MDAKRTARGWPRLLASFEAASATAALAVLVFLLLGGETPNILTALTFGLLMVGAENSAVLLPHSGRVSPSLMVVMAAISAFDGRGTVLGAALTGSGGGLVLRDLRRGRVRVMVFNAAQYALAGAAAGATYEALGDAAGQLRLLAAAASFAAVNMALFLTVVVLETGASRTALWRDMRPNLPHYLVFGLLGILIGELYSAIGALAIVILVGPLFVARSVFLAVVRLREAKARLEVLYGFSRATAQTKGLSETLDVVLGELCRLLDAGHAELVLDTEDGQVLRTLVDDRGPRVTSTMLTVPRHFATLEQPTLFARGDDALGFDDAMLAPITSGERRVGSVLVANRRSDAPTFGPEDLQVLEALANHTSVSVEMGKLVDRLSYESTHDSLTGLPNRTAFIAALQEELNKAGETGRKVAILIVDVDRFKDVNYTLGQANGDTLLCQLSARLSEVAAMATCVARVGGDEFGLVVPLERGPIEAAGVVDVLHPSLSQPFVVGDLRFEVGASVGIAIYPDHAADDVLLMHRADVAMQAAKEARSGWAVYEEHIDQYSPRRLALTGELRHALEQDQLSVVYQPKADMRSGQTVGVEALLRWTHPEQGMVPPGEFIPIAEHTDLIHPITYFVLGRALEDCLGWWGEGFQLSVAVNLSARALTSELPTAIARLLAESTLPPSALHLEITETTIMADPGRSFGILDRLAAQGLSLSVDDFGTGYSSLSYLKRLPVAELKIDRMFVADMMTSPEDLVIVRSTVDLAHNLGLRVVAEGVEDAATWDRLVEVGCDQAQGYFLSPPLPAPQITARLRASRPTS